MTRDGVAAEFGIAHNHRSRWFRTHGSRTFGNYRTQVRIDWARHLLNNDSLKLEEIAARCGHGDAPYFCHVFKRLAKLTAADYRGKVRRICDSETSAR